MDINCGDAFKSLTAAATASKGINAHFARKFGPTTRGPAVYAQGDIITSVVTTHGAKPSSSTTTCSCPALRQPLDDQGTAGCTTRTRRRSTSWVAAPRITSGSRSRPSRPSRPTWWKTLMKNRPERHGHGGTDQLELQEFIKAVRNRTQTPIDVYDSVTMSVITPLSECPRQGRRPGDCPDFTRGTWGTRQPTSRWTPDPASWLLAAAVTARPSNGRLKALRETPLKRIAPPMWRFHTAPLRHRNSSFKLRH